MYILFKFFLFVCFCKGIDNGIANHPISFSEMFSFFVLLYISSSLIMTKNLTTSFSNILWAQAKLGEVSGATPLHVTQVNLFR